MCLAVPAKIVEVNHPNATIEIEGLRRLVNVAFIENPSPGDYVLVHAGFAIRKWSDEDVREYWKIMEEAGLGANPDAETASDKGSGQ